MHPPAADFYQMPPGQPALPLLAPVQQAFARPVLPLAELDTQVQAGLAQHGTPVIGPGMRVAITAGSRGIANIARVLAGVVAFVRQRGAAPLVVAAMGSHGGATAAGQRAVLAGYGLTPERLGCPVVCSLETVQLGSTAAGVPVYASQAAYQADAIVLVNRVKPHSILTGEQGSGLLKMAAIGLGSHAGAAALHRAGLAAHLLPVAQVVLARAPVRLGVALLENAYDETCRLVVVPAAQIEDTDRRLLAEARALLPGLPLDPLDVLIVDQVGKNFSGTGMDPNVIGMHRRIGGPPVRTIRRIVALDLSPESHGNAHGIGMADIITQQLRARIDWRATHANALTADFLAGCRLPLTCATPAEAVALAMQPFPQESARVVRIRSTAHLDTLWVSAALLDEVARVPHVHQTGPLAVPQL